MICDGLIVLAHARIDAATVAVGEYIFRVQADRLAVIGKGFVFLAGSQLELGSESNDDFW